VAGQDEAFLHDWVASVDPGADLTMDFPLDGRPGHGVSAYLLEIAPGAPPRGTSRPPLQLWLRYLVTTWSDDPLQARRLLLDLAFAAMGQSDFEIATEPLPPEIWTALGTAPRPSFVLRAAVRRDRPEIVAPRVLLPLIVEPGRFIAVAGVVLGPNDQALSGAEIDVVGLGRGTRTDSRGRFRLSSLPGDPVATRLRVRAKGVEVVVGVPPDPEQAQRLIIHVDPLEGGHGRTAHA
jgi:Carboxypeptidase regulatory-like domain